MAFHFHTEHAPWLRHRLGTGHGAAGGNRTAERWVLTTLGVAILCNALLIAALVVRHEPFPLAVSRTAPGYAARLLQPTDVDSWQPIALADRHHAESPDGDIYGVFFEHETKFQYPPTALSVWSLLPTALYTGPESLQPGTNLRLALRLASAVAVLLTIGLSLMLLKGSVRADSPAGRGDPLFSPALIAGAVLLGLSFYPLTKGFSLGQVQVFIDCFVAGSLLSYVRGYRGLAGFLFGLCCLFKPQYGVILLWGLVRRDWKFAAWLSAVALGGLAVSLVQFGLHNHLRYLDVLGYISTHGETYWANQSVNGVLNRFLGNGPTYFTHSSFPPYDAAVYYGMLISSVLLLTVAVWPIQAGRSAFDLALAVLAATMASPVAWEHHYGVLLPVLAATVPALMRTRPLGRFTGTTLLLSYLMVANVLLRPAFLFANRYLGLAASHLFLGALLLLAVCVLARSRVAARVWAAS
jgi:alpha-1,2-mannosyltransferase